MAMFWATLAEAAVRELREEVGIALEPAALGEPVETSYAEFTWAGARFEQDQTFYAVLIGEVEVTFAGQEALEQATTDKHGWLLPEDLESGQTSRPADPEIPRLMRLAVAAVQQRPA